MIYNLLFFLLVSKQLFIQDDYKKYSVYEGRILYEYSGTHFPKPKYLMVQFSEYGSSEILQGSLFDTLSYDKIVRTGEIQKYYRNDTLVCTTNRKEDLLIDKFVRERYNSYQGIVLAKQFKIKHLGKKCEGFGHFDFHTQNDLAGSVHYYADILMYAHVYDSQTGHDVYIKSIEAEFCD